MIRRHSLVWLQTNVSLGSAEAKQWRDAGNPFIVCRTRPEESLSLGFCRPDHERAKPIRLAVAAEVAMIAKIERPPIWESAPRSENFTVRLIGSRMWEKLIGERYVRADSDLDLVVDLDSSAAADSAADFLAVVQRKSPIAFDAEFSFPGLGEIHWKEWRSSSPQVLVKSLDGVRLIARADLP